MKKIYSFLFFAFFAFSNVSSQVIIALVLGDKLNTDKLDFGLVVSPTLTDITGIDAKIKAGLDLGLFFNIKLNDRFYFHPEAIPKLSFGAKDIKPYPIGDAHLDSLFADGGSVKRSVKAIGLPLLMRYRVAGRFFVEAGPQVNLTLQAKDIFELKADKDDLSYEKTITNEFTRFDVGYVLGAAFKLFPSKQSVTMGLRYYGGVIDVMKNTSSVQHNSAWLLNVYIPIGVTSNKKVDEVK